MLTTRMNGQQIMPLLMNFTPATKIEEACEIEKIVYDENLQIVYDMRNVGTKSLRQRGTKVKSSAGTTVNKLDNKNEIDDSRTVR